MQSSSDSAGNGTKAIFYRQICEQLNQLLSEEGTFVANAANTSALLFQLLPDVSWVGFYMAQEDDLVLGPFQGKPACVRIPLGKGVCGTAAAESKTIIVPDVDRFEGHIACDASARSEIVVPLISWGKVVGVLDVDSASLNRFDEDDKEGLESVASVLLAAQSTEEFPDFEVEDATE